VSAILRSYSVVVEELGLRLADGSGDGSWREAFLVDAEIAEDVLDEPA
jgi:hypothetical protein